MASKKTGMKHHVARNGGDTLMEIAEQKACKNQTPLRACWQQFDFYII
jgi:hypothetical protein